MLLELRQVKKLGQTCTLTLRLPTLRSKTKAKLNH